MIRFLWSDGSLVALNGPYGMTLFEDKWYPPGGSLLVATSAFEDERTRELSEAEAVIYLEKTGAPLPSFEP